MAALGVPAGAGIAFGLTRVAVAQPFLQGCLSAAGRPEGLRYESRRVGIRNS